MRRIVFHVLAGSCLVTDQVSLPIQMSQFSASFSDDIELSAIFGDTILQQADGRLTCDAARGLLLVGHGLHARPFDRDARRFRVWLEVAEFGLDTVVGELELRQQNLQGEGGLGWWVNG